MNAIVSLSCRRARVEEVAEGEDGEDEEDDMPSDDTGSEACVFPM